MWPVVPTDTLILRLDELKTLFYPATPDFALLKLYQNDVSPDANSFIGQFTEATFTGYADVELTMTAARVNDQNLVVSTSNICSFSRTDNLSSQTIYGIYITDATNSILLAAQRFDTPQVMSGLTDVIRGVWRVSEPISNYGWISIE